MRQALFSEHELGALRAAACRVETLVRSWRGRGRRYEIDGFGFRDVGDVTLQYEHSDQPGVAVLPRVVEPVHSLDPRFDALAGDARLVEPACGLIGQPRAALFTDKLNFKRPRAGSAFRWHQDSPYWAHRPGVWQRIEELPNVLVHLDPSDETNGCFRVMAGSHRNGVLPSRPDGTSLAALFTDPDVLDPSAERALTLPAGSAVFFHPHLVHGSHPNHSTQPRRAVVLTYQASGNPMLKIDRVRDVA